jgi:antitoxin component YwqK of YwqJK toxin-antitoxin module
VLRIHDEQGALAQEATYVKGVRQGITRIYLQGRLLAVQQFAAGVLHGETTSYAESGDVASRQKFFQGRLQGESVFLHEGVAVRRALFHKGKLEGETTTFDRDGALVQREIYKDNLLEGPLTRYWPDGQVMERILYRAGKPVEKPRRFDRKGVELRDQAKATLMQRLELLVRG